MSEARTILRGPFARHSNNDRAFADYLLVAIILVIMTVIEVQFLWHVAGPDTVSLIQAADCIVTPDQIIAGNDELPAWF